MLANYGGVTAPTLRAGDALLATCPTEVPTTDTPQYEAGLDCDNDGGEIAYLTPQGFTVALKRLTFFKEGGEAVEFLPPTDTLAQSQRVELTAPVELQPIPIPAGFYTHVRAEIYYFEITLPLYGSNQTIRVYMSDDDFAAEGSLGHHQGDIVLVNADGTEMGWIPVDDPWTTDYLQQLVGGDGASIVRPGSDDGETGHQRGHFGNADLWDQELFQQGNDRDVFILEAQLPFDLTPGTEQTATFTFNVANTWFWEDFDGSGTFNPCDGGTTLDACDGTAEWAPLFHPPQVTVD